MDFGCQAVAEGKPSVVVVGALSIVAAEEAAAEDQVVQTETAAAGTGLASVQGLLARLMLASDLDSVSRSGLANLSNSKVDFA